MIAMTIGEKVTIKRDNETVYGIIIWVSKPCKEHSGRFGVHIHERNREHDAEFWFSDIEKTVFLMK